MAEPSNSTGENSFRNFYFEIRSSLGLTEIHALLAPGVKTVKSFSIRFSVLSPSSVIEQTFAFLNNLAQLAPVKVFDTDGNHKVLALSATEFKLNRHKVRRRQIIIDNETGLVIEGGDATNAYSVAYNLTQRMWLSGEAQPVNLFKRLYSFLFKNE